jgi:hypothetical protein
MAERRTYLGRSVTVYDAPGPKSARRQYVAELGGWISRRQSIIAATGKTPERKAEENRQRRARLEQMRQQPIYWRNADRWAMTHGMSVGEADRDADFIDLQFRIAEAKENRDWSRLERLLRENGYDFDDFDEATGDTGGETPFIFA